MSSGPSDREKGKLLRILTIDNGGLQAISILRVLKEVCQRLSKEDGHKTPLRPCQLFDIIGGVGTGGWLAILLGRYRLRIDQCMSIYVNIANAIDPTRTRQDGTSVPGGSVALDQNVLVEKIDKIVEEHKIGEHLFDEEFHQEKDSMDRCHAFAVGVVQRPHTNATQEYRLFRTYQPPGGAKHQGPDPAKCKVSSACAATAAAKDFLGEWRLDVDKVTYWDDTFPLTHNVSTLALDEAESLFGKDRSMNLNFVLNISPGVATKKDVQELQGTTPRTTSSTHVKRRAKVRRFFSANRLHDLTKLPMYVQQARSATYHEGDHKHKAPGRSDTSSSTSSEASQTELGHQKAIRKRLQSYAQTSGRADLYYRLELSAQNDKPYLDDIAKPDLAMQLAQEFLDHGDTETILNTMIPQHSITERPTSQSPRESFASVKDFVSIEESPAIKAH